MPDPVLAPALAKDWVERLLVLWTTIRGTRKAELLEIKARFGDPQELARFYVEPDCQLTNPADHHEEEPYRTFRQPVREWLNGFIKGEFFERDGRNTLFLLSDAGMGKTSLLMMLKLSHMTKFWPSGIDFRLLQLGADTLEKIALIEDKSKTVLLLDALEEDGTPWDRLKDRLHELLHATKPFRQVILTCRTQFFPTSGKDPVERPGRIEAAGFVCNLIYLSPFNDSQVEKYLYKVFPNKFADRLKKLLNDQDNHRIGQARRLVSSMQSLRMRPMLLSFIRDLMTVTINQWSEYAIYKALVEFWLLREVQKKPHGPTKDNLWRAYEAAALQLQTSGQTGLTSSKLGQPLGLQPIADHVEVLAATGRALLNRTTDGGLRFAHYTIQEFFVAHALIEQRERPRPLRVTGQVLRFVHSWAITAPQERVHALSWEGLEFHVAEKRGIALVYVPGGEYRLGAKDLDETAQPIHRVFLAPFWIGKVPVTNEQYGRFLAANSDRRKPAFWDDGTFNSPQQPVVGVDWEDARAFCAWVGATLPSEAQWEAAARSIDERRYPWGNEEPTAERVSLMRPIRETTPVGSYPAGAGPFGALDQAGNVWEWCLDGWEPRAYKSRDGQTDPVVESAGAANLRVVRGGPSEESNQSLRAAFRSWNSATFQDLDLGFRVVFRPSAEL